MDRIQILRLLFQIAALSIFIYQMQQSVGKYRRGPVVTETSSTTIDSIPKPVILVCKQNYIDKKTKAFGYNWATEFLAGYFKHSSLATWKGGYMIDMNFENLEQGK